MKKNLISMFLICFGIVVYSKGTQYATKLNIHYYSDSINQSDGYINERCVLDIYYPENVKAYPTIVWFHGGGLTEGYKEIPDELKEKGVCVIGVNYRLYPKVNCPKYIEDAAAATAWVFNNIKGYGEDSTIRKERGVAETQPVIDEFAPLFHVRADAPQLLLITGDRELELLGRYEENAYLIRMMKVVGHKETKLYEIDGYGHGMAEPAFPLLLNEVERIHSKSKSALK